MERKSGIYTGNLYNGHPMLVNLHRMIRILSMRVNGLMVYLKEKVN